MVASVSLGGIAAIVFAVFWAGLVIFLCYMLFKVAVVLESTKTLLDGVTQETVPLLHEVKGTVEGTNREIDRVDVVLDSSGKIIKNIERLSSVIEQTVSSPLIKIAAAGAGLAAVLRGRRGKGKDE